ncbi:MAG: UvrD-helicase domain-containing protein [Coriobacteriia bacterium]
MADLDPRQELAVDFGPTDVFVAAGAGSGKTRVLSARFVSAVLGRGSYEACQAEQLVAVTFTEKAAGELAERIRGALAAAGEPAAARSVGEAWISTIHGMCSRILRRHALTLGLDPRFRVLDEIEASVLEAQALEDVVRDRLADEAFSALLGVYRFPDVVNAAKELTDTMRSLDQEPDAIGRVSRAEARGEAARALQELRDLAAEFAQLRRIATVEHDHAAVLALLEAAEHEAASGCETASCERLLEAAISCRLKRLRSVEGLSELVDACEAQIDRLTQAAAQMAVGCHEETFLAFAAAYDDRYRRLKEAAGTVDFEDLQLLTVRLLESRPDVAERYRRHFAMLMLDEFQDTNELQMRIIGMLSRGNLCTVGDENQSIYSFRHADVEIFRQRERAATAKAELDINYRTAAPLLESINALFAHPALLGSRYLPLRSPDEPRTAVRPWPGPLARFETRFIDASAGGDDSRQVEAERIAERAAELLAGGLAPGDIAILMRSLAGGRAATVEAALIRRGIPVFATSGGSFFERSEVVEARALLRSIANVRDDSALAVVLASRLTGLGADGLVRLRAHADEIARERGCGAREVRLWEAATSPALDLCADDLAAVGRTVHAIEQARDRRGAAVLSEAVLEPLLALDFDLVLFALGRRGQRAWANMLKLARIAGEYESATGGALASFLEYLDLREMHASSEQEATLDGESGAVRVMSIHASKGLEFPAVIVAGLAAPHERGPFVLARDHGAPVLGMTLPRPGGSVQTMGSARALSAATSAAEAEAARLLYVACTRAEECLTIIARTKADKEAGRGLGDLVRRALGMGEAGALRPEGVRLGSAAIEVTIAAATLPECVEEPRTFAPEAAQTPGTHSAPVTPARGHSGARRHGVPPRISYTGLATYGRCPLRFRLTSQLRLPAPPAAQQGEALVFGRAVHAALERCVTPGHDVDAIVAEAARAAALDERAQGRLRAAVDTFLSSEVTREIRASQRVLPEARIAVPLYGTVLAGAMDLLAWRCDHAMVVDYKTGTEPLALDAAEERYRLQGECYALATFRAGASSVRVVFAEIERGREVSYSYDRDDARSLEERVAGIVARMAEDGFDAHATYEAQLCETCPGLGSLCPVTRPKRDAAG